MVENRSGPLKASGGLAVLTALAVLCVSASSCLFQEAGSFRLHLAWEDGPPDFGDAGPYVLGRVEERTEPTAPGVTLGEATPVAYVSGVQLDFPPIRYGNSRVVIVEIRDGPAPSDAIIYYGISEPFKLERGVDVEVRVLLRLRSTPSAVEPDLTAKGASARGIRILSDDGSGRVRNSTVSLLLITDTGTRAKLARDLDFQSPETWELTELDVFNEELPEGARGYVGQWDLDPDNACPPAYCVRRVYVIFIDAQGYESAPASAEVVLDTQAPELIAEAVTVSPREKADADAILLVSLAFKEQLRSTPLLRIGERVGFFDRVAPQEDEPSTTYTFRAREHAIALGNEGDYAVTVQAVDLAGNTATSLDVGTIELDLTPPEIGDLTARGPTNPGHANLADREGEASISITFDVNEELDSQPYVKVGVHDAVCEAEGWLYTCLYALATTDTDGEKLVSVTATDKAGNSTEQSVALHFDFVPPSGTLGLSPQRAPEGATLTVRYQASESLAVLPSLTVILPDMSEDTGIFGAPAVDGLAYTFSHELQPTDPDGTWSFRLSGIKDPAGNSGADSSGELVVDQSAPVVLASTVSPLLAKADTSVTVTFTASEPQTTDYPTLSVGGLSVAVSATANPNEYSASTTLSGADGTKAVEVGLRDLAGNTAFLSLEPVGLDTSGPAGTLDISPDPAPEGARITVRYQASEPLGASPTLAVTLPDASDGAALFETPSIDGLAYTFSRTLQPTDPDGSWSFKLSSIQDDAGNVGVDASGELVVDQSAPSVLASTVSPVRARADTVVTVTFTASETQASGYPTLSVGGSSVALSATANPDEYSCNTTLAGATGTKAVEVGLRDLAGNTAFVNLQTVSLDTSEPTGTLDLSPDPASKGARITVRYQASEPLAATPSLAVTLPDASDGSARFGSATTDGQVYTFSYSLQAGDPDGTWRFTVGDVEDVAGNRGSSTTESVQVDQTAPDLELFQQNGSSFRSDSTLTATLTATEVLSSAPVVKLGTSPVGLVSGSGKGPYSYSLELSTVSFTGSAPITVELVDIAGNGNFVSAGSAVLDTVSPAVVPGSEGIQLVGAENNVMSMPTQVTDGTTIRLSFTVTELLAAAPAVKATSSDAETPEVLTFSAANEAGTSYVFEHTLAGLSHDQGAYSIRVTATDAAGNEGTVTLSSSFHVDTADPTSPDVVTADRIIYTRVPWGSNATSGIKSFTLEGSAGAVEPLATVLVYDEADVTKAAELGRAVALADGSFPAFALNRVDRQVVYVTAADAAGNVADADAADGVQAAAVRDVVWIATMGRKVAGSTYENPHHYELRGWFATRHTQLDSEEVAATELQDVGDSPLKKAGAVDWEVAWLDAASPSGRFKGVTVYDSVRERVLLFGGFTDAGANNETWECNGASWKKIIPSDPESDGDPSPRRGHAMAYDSARQRVVLFGGGFGSDANGETWEWDGASWKNVTPTDPEADGNPSARYGHAMAFDSVRKRVVLHGGYNGSYRSWETWEWDGASWEKKIPTDPESDGNPSSRYEHGIVYDSVRSRIVLFGGKDPSADNETWEWNGSSWKKITPTDPESDGNPSPRYYNVLAYDSVRQRVVLFGGFIGWGDDQTWEYNGSSWKKITPTDPESDGNPVGRYGHALVYDTARARSFLFAGTETSGHRNDEAWQWNGSSWKKMIPADPESDGNPAQRHGHGFVYDSGRERMVVFGGFDTSGYDDETWEWNGLTWTKRTPTDPESDGNPCPRFRHTMAYDSARGRSVMYGGSFSGGDSDETWEYNGSSWRKMTPTDPESDGNPSTLHSHAMVYDSNRQRVVVFGGIGSSGSSNTDTWEWNGTSWRKMSPTDPEGDGDPPRRFRHAMAHDSTRGRTVLFGGYSGGYYGDTWEWDGVSWAQMTPTDPESDGDPSPRHLHVMAYDSTRRRVVLFGGQDDAGYDDELWEWDGTSWAKIAFADPGSDGNPAQRYMAGLAYDSGRRRMVLFGGSNTNGRRGDLWQWDTDKIQGSRPGQVFKARFGAATSESGIQLLAVSTDWYAGGVGYPGGVETTGALLKLADKNVFVDVAANLDGTAAPALLSFDTDVVDQLNRLLVGPEKEVAFAVTPAHENGTGLATIAVDYAEVRIKYRRP